MGLIVATKKISLPKESVDSTVTADGYTSKTAEKIVHAAGKVAEIASFVVPGAKAGAAVGKAAGEVFTELAARRAAEAAAKHTAETTAAARYGKAGGEAKTIFTQGKATTSSTSGAKSITPDSSKIEVTTRTNTPAQRAGVQAAGDTKRAAKISNAAADTYDAVKKTSIAPKTGKIIGGAAGVVAGAAVAKGTQPDHKITTVDRKTGKAK